VKPLVGDGSPFSRQATLDDAVQAIRFFPITVTLPRLMDAVDRARAAARAIEGIRAAPADLRR
jgi:hypothetical protein